MCFVISLRSETRVRVRVKGPRLMCEESRRVTLQFLSWWTLVSCRLADFVIHLREGTLAVQLIPEFVVQASVKHFPEFLAFHVDVSIKHLEAEQKLKVKRRTKACLERAKVIMTFSHRDPCV